MSLLVELALDQHILLPKLLIQVLTLLESLDFELMTYVWNTLLGLHIRLLSFSAIFSFCYLWQKHLYC